MPVRHRRVVQITLSDEARAKLAELAALYDEPRSQTVERLVLRASLPEPRYSKPK